MRRASGKNVRPAGVRRTARTLQEPHAKDAFENLDLPAQRRLGHMESLGGPAEMQLLGGRDEATELTELEQRCNSCETVIL
jgi:hypothetical protein